MALPCGVTSADELDPYGQTAVGTCTVAEIRGDYVLQEDGRPILRSSDSGPSVALDSRVPGPGGLRVGMTGAEIRAQLTDYGWVECHAFAEVFECEVRRVAETPECGEGAPDDAIWVHLDRPGGVNEGDELDGPAAWSAIDASPVTGVVLSMPC